MSVITLLGNTLPKISPPRRSREQSPGPTDQVLADAFERAPQREFPWGALALGSLSLLGVACTSQPAPVAASEHWIEAAPSGEVCLSQENLTPRVIVVDDFSTAATGTTHGEIVEAELVRDLALQGPVLRHQVGLYGGDFGLSQGRPGALDDFLRDHFAGRMARDTEALQEILLEGGARAVIHQSQGASQSRVVDELYYRALRDQEFGGHLQNQLGLSSTRLDTVDGKRELLSALVETTDQMYHEDATVAEQRQDLRRVQEQLHEKGHIHVISAGNQGHLYRDMLELGITTPAQFFTNDFAGPHSIIVGAADNRSREAQGAGFGVAAIASPVAGAHLAADGVDRPLSVDGSFGHHTGSSYAAPQVSRTILEMLRVEPGLSRNEILTQLQSAALPVPGAESYLGAGVLDTPAILLCRITAAQP